MVTRVRGTELREAVEEMVDHAKKEMTQSARDRAVSATFDDVTALAASEKIINAGFEKLKKQIRNIYTDDDEQVFALMQLKGMEIRSYGSLRERLMPIFLKAMPNQRYA